jgi:hypothetical protein
MRGCLAIALVLCSGCFLDRGVVDNGGASRDGCVAALETCNGIDDDCDGRTDEELMRECGGGAGACAAGTQRCENGDWGTCEGATGPVDEVCEGSVDEDCDSAIDEGCACEPGASRACGESEGACEPGTQRCTSGEWSACEGAVGPTEERCDGDDDDCDGTVDDGVTLPLFRDSDGDGFGDPAMTMPGCEEGSGYVANSMDCDDACTSCRPGGTEICDGFDQNCNGVPDDGAGMIYYTDADGDGYGTGAPIVTCVPGEGLAMMAGDCDDDCAICSPAGNDMVCDGNDGDCDGSIDEEGGPSGGPCPCTWDELGGHAYLFCTGAYTWAEANEECESLGYHLAKIETEDEDDWLWDRAEDHHPSENDWWLGLTDTATEGSFVWTDGTAVTYEGWADDEPNDANDGPGGLREDCGQLSQAAGGNWNDLDCGAFYLGFLCEAAPP